MKINLKRMTVLVALLGLAAGCASNATAQQASAQVSPPGRVVSFHGDMAALLSAIGSSFGVTIGLEADPLKSKSEVRVEVQDATVQDVLNAIVQSEPRYRWRENDGVFEVFPISGSNPLLEMTISNFRSSDVSPQDAVNQLLNLPEVSAVSMSMKLKFRAVSYPPARTKELTFSISLEGVTLRQALDRIAKESGAKFWLFRKYDDGSFSVGTSCW